jgi:hypothetical protein
MGLALAARHTTQLQHPLKYRLNTRSEDVDKIGTGGAIRHRLKNPNLLKLDTQSIHNSNRETNRAIPSHPNQ